MRYEMFAQRLLVRVLDDERRTKGGLFIPESSMDKSPFKVAEVLEVGQGRLMANGTLVPLLTKKGDIIRFFRSMDPGNQVVVPLDDEYGGGEGLSIIEDSILCYLRDLDKTSPLVSASGSRLVMA